MAQTLTGATIASTYKTLLKAGTQSGGTVALSSGSTTEQLVFGEDDAADVRTAIYVSQDRVGIGSAAPSQQLTVASATGGQISIRRDQSNITNNENMGALNWESTENSGTNVGLVASIYVKAAEAFVENANEGSSMHFAVTPNTGETQVEAMKIENDGNVGIGNFTTIAPASLLNLAKVSAAATLNIDTHVGSAAGSILKFQHSRHTDIGSHTAVQTGDVLGHIYFSGSDGDEYIIGARITAATKETWDNDSAGTYISFSTVKSGVDSQTLAEVMRIDHNKRVGIGVTVPDSILHIEETTANTILVVKIEAASADAAGEGALAYFQQGANVNCLVGSYYNGTAHAGTIAMMDDSTNFNYTYYNGAVLMTSTTNTHVGTASGTIIGDQTSDERLKNISPDPFPYGLEDINKLTPIKYQYKDDRRGGIDHIGFGAQTTLPIIPESVYNTKQCIDGYTNEICCETNSNGVEEELMVSTPKSDDPDTELGMKYVEIIPVLVKAVQELSAKVTALENA